MVSASAHLGRWVQRHSVLAKAASWGHQLRNY
jgi:hypothetical protein